MGVRLSYEIEHVESFGGEKRTTKILVKGYPAITDEG
jgi:hypothetical protein